MNVIGIDPGEKGALVRIEEIRNNIALTIIPFKSIDNFRKIVPKILDELLDTKVYLENVHSFSGQGVSSTFSFGRNVGLIQGVLMAGYATWESPTPMMWQKELGLANPYPTKKLRKQAHLKKAKSLFPEYRDLINMDTADAVLIAEYGYRKEKQKESYYGI